MRRTLCLLLAFAAHAQTTTDQSLDVAGLTQILQTAATSHQPDPDTAAQISRLKITQRITETRLAALQALAPGPLTSAKLEQLTQQTAFLDAPAADQLNLPTPPTSEQRQIFARILPYLANYAHRLPNLICTESIERFDDDQPVIRTQLSALGLLHFVGAIKAQITYSAGVERVAIQQVDDQPYTGGPIFGITTSGEFGNMLITLFEPYTHVSAVWSHWEQLHGQPVAVFTYSVPLKTSRYRVTYKVYGQKGKFVRSAYHGLLFVDPASGTILRVTQMTTGIPPTFPIHQVNTSIEYAPVAIGSQSYILPVRSVNESDDPLPGVPLYSSLRVHSLNETRFTNYRLYGAESKIVDSDMPIVIPPQH